MVDVDVSGLPDDFAAALVRQNAVNTSWRRRLQFVRELFTVPDAADRAAFDPSRKVHLVYLV
eukprot:CAMPEP_0198329844 /NCGR_PEP_ID=MMETSP1450-20131203/16492_1 /TAXON_ID=753684 ORGANISM="Madagascaria erythrocladiodes, Strain CCMP3234" /NCGR_SAMPLE_ID=MMETSP1450 /ASSEMBLY_ACC=CAM_ASM_001115 /LENGTH=61 /DNA_ID=CAMNT_0044034097 /DNA_START=21 /DNA_END=203 /DNA_ORIENTATION=+